MLNYKDQMLNANVQITQFKDADPDLDEFFTRPCLDDKSFSGMVTTKKEFKEWQTKVVELNVQDSFSSIKSTDEIIIAPLTEIYSEYRFYVVNGKIITGSRYKLGNQVLSSSEVDEGISQYAQEMVDIWQPNKAFVIDIADTPNGLKVIEINSINSSGFYKCDMGKFVYAINNMKIEPII